jgi:hypothetical protein
MNRNQAAYDKRGNSRSERLQFIFFQYKNAMNTNEKKFRTQNNGDAIHSYWTRKSLITNDKLKILTGQLRKCGPRQASLCVLLFEGARLL